jgi:predicted component of type VI protein secretion system
MISIRESIADLERIDELQNALLECYRAALQAMAQYAVEFDDGATASYRKHVAALSGCCETNCAITATKRPPFSADYAKNFREKRMRWI